MKQISRKNSTALTPDVAVMEQDDPHETWALHFTCREYNRRLCYSVGYPITNGNEKDVYKNITKCILDC